MSPPRARLAFTENRAAPKEVGFTYDHAPTLKAFSESDALVRGVLGPVGAGKSSACVWECFRRGMAQAPGPDGVRRTRGVVVRNTRKELADTTLKTWFEWFPPGVAGTWHKTDQTYWLRARDATGKLVMVSEILFRAMDIPKQARDVLSLEVTWAWLNEARELEEAIFRALLNKGRLGRYPSRRAAGIGATWHGLWMDTNPPDDLSWWYRVFEEDEIDNEAYQLFRQPGGRSPGAENLPNLPPSYYEDAANGASEQYIKVYIDAQYGTVEEGKPIYRGQWNDRLHVSDVELWPIKRCPIGLGWDFGLCYDDQTEVLTKRGWQFFKDVDPATDQVATRDPVSGAMEYVTPNFKVDRLYSGELLQWANTEINFCVTPEHRVPYTRRDYPGTVLYAEAQWLAEHMTAHHFVDVVSTWSAPEFDPERRYFGMDAMTFAQFMGMYLSEGSTGSGHDHRITIYQRDRREDWEQILLRTGLDWRWNSGGTNGKTSGWRTNGGDLCTWLARIACARDKRVPDEIKAMPSEQIRAFIGTYTQGDGHVRVRKNGAEEHTVFSSSKHMADDLQELAQKAGWNAAIRIVKPQTSVIVEGGKDRPITNTGGYCVTFKKRAKRAELLRRNFQRIEYTGRIYCLNVPHHTLYVRRGGKAHWNGNTPAVVIIQLTPRGQLRVLDEVVGTDMGVQQLIRGALKPLLATKYKGFEIAESIGDPSGESRADTDERSPFDIVHAEGLPITAAPSNDPKHRWEWVRYWLTALRDGQPAFLLSPGCKHLRRGFNGRYKLRRLQVSGPEARYAEKADKNDASHPHDALQYVCSAFVPENLLPAMPPRQNFAPADQIAGY